MNFSEKLYVGFQRDRYAHAEEPRLLGFAVPYGTTKAEQKRIATVDQWSNNKAEARILDNVPTRGFKLLQVVSRYSTSNKLFRVLDPRGFELEISADNILSLALASTIVRGEIIEECVWAQHNGVYLIPTSDERYRFWKGIAKGAKTKIEVGKYYVNPSNLLSIFRFEGIFHHTSIECKHVATEGTVERIDNGRNDYWSQRQHIVNITAYQSNVKLSINPKTNPMRNYDLPKFNPEIARQIFAVGLEHEDRNERDRSGEYLAMYRKFYEAARAKRAEQLHPGRKAAEARQLAELQEIKDQLMRALAADFRRRVEKGLV